MKRRTTLIMVIALALALANYTLAQRRWTQGYAVSSAEVFHDGFLWPPAALVRALSLNHDSLAASLVWVQGLLYFGSYRVAQAPTPPAHLADYTRLIHALDPQFRSPFEWFTSTYLQSRAEVTFQDLEHVSDVLELAIKAYPGEATYLHQAGINYIGFSASRSPQQRIHELERGIGYLERAAQLPDAPKTTLGVISFMRRRKAQLEAQLRGEPTVEDRQAQLEFYLGMYQVTLEPEQRTLLRAHLRALGVPDATLDVQDQALIGRLQREYEQRRPYLPLDLWVWTEYPHAP